MILDYFRKKTEVKEAPFAESVTTSYNFGQRNREFFYKEGYKKNSVVYKCINKISNAAACLHVELVREKTDGTFEVVTDHPLAKLLDKPNPRLSRKNLIKLLFIDYYSVGEFFLSRNAGESYPTELWRMNPNNVEIEGGSNSMVVRYKYQGTGGSTYFQVDQLTGYCREILHYFMPDPTDNWRGMSPMEAVADWVDVINNGAYWNASLLHNGGNITGIISIPDLDAESTRRFMEDWRNRYEGAQNAGKTAFINSDAKYTTMSTPPKDMDFERSMIVAARNIADGYGVPFPLISPEASTFNNMAAALEDFYEDTVLPAAQAFYEALNDWLVPQFKDTQGLKIRIKEDSLPALEGRNERKTNRIAKLKLDGIISTNEAREKLGFEKIEDESADALIVSSSSMPLDDIDVSDVVDQALTDLQNGETE